VANRARVAGRMPVHTSSAGLALMAHQDRQLQGNYLDQFADPDGKATADAVRVLLGETFHQGFAQLKGVVDPDTWGIAVPVLDARQRAVASLGVVVPLREMRLQALVPALQTAARGIARRLNDA
jgi:DNA-binding IclR family transcriptional regulator